MLLLVADFVKPLGNLNIVLITLLWSPDLEFITRRSYATLNVTYERLVINSRSGDQSSVIVMGHNRSKKIYLINHVPPPSARSNINLVARTGSPDGAPNQEIFGLRS